MVAPNECVKREGLREGGCFSSEQLNSLEMSIPKLRTVYFDHSAVGLCEIMPVPEIHVKSLDHDVSCLIKLVN